jgi:hypothetical protein
MPRVHHVKKARKADKDSGIKKGESYYWWKFRYGGKRKSKTYPRPQQLTQSGFLMAVYDIDDMKNCLQVSDEANELQASLETIKEAVETLKEECEESFENIPDQLQDTGSAGILLTERIEALEEYYNELDNIDVDIAVTDEDELQEIIDSIQGCELNC